MGMDPRIDASFVSNWARARGLRPEQLTREDVAKIAPKLGIPSDPDVIHRIYDALLNAAAKKTGFDPSRAGTHVPTPEGFRLSASSANGSVALAFEERLEQGLEALFVKLTGAPPASLDVMCSPRAGGKWGNGGATVKVTPQARESAEWRSDLTDAITRFLNEQGWTALKIEVTWPHPDEYGEAKRVVIGGGARR